jgi:hypothetical protein
MCVCANPPRELCSACHTTPAPLCTNDVHIARATSVFLISFLTHFMPRWHSGMGRHVCGAWKKTCLVRAALQRSLRCASIPTCSPRSWLIRSRSAYVMYSRVNSVNAHRAALGIEPRTSRTLSENHTTRPSSQLTAGNVCSKRGHVASTLWRENEGDVGRGVSPHTC